MALRPDPLTADRRSLDRALVELQRRYRTASHVVAAGVTPEGCDDETVDWWRNAFQAVQQRRWSIDIAVTPHAVDVRKTELRPQRLRKPPR